MSYRLPNSDYHDVFNSDSSVYGGANVGNGGATLSAINEILTFAISSIGIIVFAKVSSIYVRKITICITGGERSVF